METRQAAHPAPRTLAAFALNRLPAEARERLQAHLRSCASCSDFLARTPQHELPARRNAEARERHHVTVQYFGNHRHRMDYPRYIAAGWQIGSGPVEAACRTVVTERLKCSGMRWGVDGADAVCHLRALWLSEDSQWESLWRDHPN